MAKVDTKFTAENNGQGEKSRRNPEATKVKTVSKASVMRLKKYAALLWNPPRKQ